MFVVLVVVWYNGSMAINILDDNYKNGDGQDAAKIEIANGDLRALKDVAEAYNVNDITDVIAFAIGVMKEADGRPIAAQKVDGTLKKFMPAESITKNERNQ